jgi:hypothetical protein
MMKKDEKLLNYCRRRKLPFTIKIVDLNQYAKLRYTANEHRCSGLSKLLQKLASEGRLDYEIVPRKGVMIRSVELKPKPESEPGDVHKTVTYVDVEAQVREVVHELLLPIRNSLGDIEESLEPVMEGIAVLRSSESARHSLLETSLKNITSHIEAISRHIGRVEVNE